LRRIACAGGLFLNVKANKLLRELDEVEDAFFYPACDDGGTPAGAALEAYYRFCERDGKKPERHALGPIYYGSEFGDEELVRALKTKGWWDRAERMDNLDAHAGELVAKGKIVARFDGGVGTEGSRQPKHPCGSPGPERHQKDQFGNQAKGLLDAFRAVHPRGTDGRLPYRSEARALHD
jgi:hypothetical protein